jgi:hypothetical protein
VLGVVVACRQVAGIQEEPPQDVKTTCGLPYAGSCGTCIERACCDAARACAGSALCAAAARVDAACIAECGTNIDCRARCYVERNAGEKLSPRSAPPETTAMTMCILTSCESECARLCGGNVFGAGGFVDVSQTQACTECVVQNACEPTRDFARSSECAELGRCSSSCTTPDCRDGCVGKLSDQGRAIVERAGKANAPCQTTCGAGTDFTCLGHVGWPNAKSDHVELRIYVDRLSAPVADADVAFCSDYDCTRPTQTGKTGPDGRLMMRFPVGFGGLGGYLLVTSPKSVPVLTFYTYPLTEPVVDVFIPAFDPSQVADALKAVGVVQDPSRGYVIADVQDCQGSAAAGVKVTTSGDPIAQEYYAANGAPARGATSTARDGTVYIANAPAGSLDLVATPEALGRPSSRMTIYVRPGAISRVVLLPTPQS